MSQILIGPIGNLATPGYHLSEYLRANTLENVINYSRQKIIRFPLPSVGTENRGFNWTEMSTVYFSLSAFSGLTTCLCKRLALRSHFRENLIKTRRCLIENVSFADRRYFSQLTVGTRVCVFLLVQLDHNRNWLQQQRRNILKVLNNKTGEVFIYHPRCLSLHSTEMECLNLGHGGLE